MFNVVNDYDVSLKANKNVCMIVCLCVLFTVKSFQTPSFQPSTASNRYNVVALLLCCYLRCACAIVSVCMRDVCVWNMCFVRFRALL